MKYDNTLKIFKFIRVLGPRSRSQWLFLEKHCHHSSTFNYGPFCCNFTQMFSKKNILINFKFQLPRAKVNIKVAILRNMLLAV